MGGLVIAATGAAGLCAFGRWGWAVAFVLGAAVSLGNFHLITRAVRRLADPEAVSASRHLWKGAIFRFAIVGITLFLAVAVFQTNILALAAGLLVTQLGMMGYWLVRSVGTPT